MPVICCGCKKKQHLAQEETRKHVFRGERVPWPPNFGPRLISTAEKGAGFFSPPKYLVPRRHIANLQNIYGILRHFAVFCGGMRCFAANLFLWPGNLAISCGVFWRFPVFCSVFWCFVAFSSVLSHFTTFSGALAISFHCGTKYLGGLKPPPPFLVG